MEGPLRNEEFLWGQGDELQSHGAGYGVVLRTVSSGNKQLCAGIGEQGSKVLRKSSVNTGAVNFQLECTALQPGIQLRTVAVCLSQTP